MVPMDTIFEELQVSVRFRKALQTIECERDNTSLSMKLGSDVITVDNRIERMSVVPVMAGESFMVPLQIVTEAFGGQYTWNEKSKTINITIQDPQTHPKIVFTTMIEPVEITVTANDQADMGADKAYMTDGNFDTRWAASIEDGIPKSTTWDLGEVKKVHGLGICWYKSSERYYSFTLEVSVDGENYITVIPERQSQKLNDYSLETYEFDEVDARYVRLTGSGNDVNPWCHVTEMRVFGPVGVDVDVE